MIRYIGVWDTVGALSVPANRLTKCWQPCAATYRFYDSILRIHVKYASHALAIDERLGLFQPVLWNTNQPPAQDQVVRQVWFAGVHADIGGGYAEHEPADLAFLWMLAQVDPLLALDTDAIGAERDTTEIYGQGTLNDSCTGALYKATAKRRTVGPGAGQYVHESVIERFQYRGFSTSPGFNFAGLPVWKRDAFEQTFAWSKAGRWMSGPHLPGRRQIVCDRVLK